MNEIGKFEVQKKKLQGLCDEHNLVYNFKKDKYPITLTIKTTGGFDGQMTMLENAEEEGYRSPDARLVFSYKDGAVDYQFSETFTITDALFSKIRNIFKNMHSFWLQFFFRDIIERHALSAQMLPQIDDDDDDAFDDAEPLEEYDDEFLDDDPPEDDDENAEDVHIEPTDAIVIEATKIVRHENKASTGLLQRHLKIGYAKAARIMASLEALGVIGAYDGGNPREVLPYDEPDDDVEVVENADEA